MESQLIPLQPMLNMFISVRIYLQNLHLQVLKLFVVYYHTKISFIFLPKMFLFSRYFNLLKEVSVLIHSVGIGTCDVIFFQKSNFILRISGVKYFFKVFFE